MTNKDSIDRQVCREYRKEITRLRRIVAEYNGASFIKRLRFLFTGILPE